MMRSRTRSSLVAVAAIALALPALTPPAFAQTGQPVEVIRTTATTVDVRWTGIKAADVFLIATPDTTIDKAPPVSANDRDGHEAVSIPAGQRGWFLVRDRANGQVIRAVERVIPLEQGSNFRDIGGYPAADGKSVRWGKVYRAGATPLLTDNDLRTIGSLGLVTMVDLRSDEERQLAPTRIDGVQYVAVGYSMKALMAGAQASGFKNGGGVYRGMPAMLSPQLKIVFEQMKRNEGAIEYNCSAGQDRTGFVTAMVLSALGTPRDVIVKDYLASTALRRPEYEMPKFDPAAFPDNFAAKLFSYYQSRPELAKPQPLMEPDGTPFLLSALDEIDRRWGSVDAYLHQAIGLTDADIAMIRANYTE